MGKLQGGERSRQTILINLIGLGSLFFVNPFWLTEVQSLPMDLQLDVEACSLSLGPGPKSRESSPALGKISRASETWLEPRISYGPMVKS